jgi:TonB family protein
MHRGSCPLGDEGAVLRPSATKAFQRGPFGLRLGPFISVNLVPSPSRFAWALLLVPLLTGRLAAQHVLLADDAGTMTVVRAANGVHALVEKNGKLVEISTRGFVLREVPEYLPVFVDVRDVAAQLNYTQANGGGQLNNDFYFRATVETSYPLTDVFIVLYYETQSGKRALILNGIGKLEPHRSMPVSIFVPMDTPLGNGHYTIHLFSGGAEVLQSQIPYMTRENALDRMVAKRIADVTAAAPKFFVGPPPEYPASLKKAGLKGQATVSIRVGANGAVNDAVVESASDPAFGDAALVAIRVWRFLPKVKDGHPVETKVDVPFIFSPPDA